MMVPPSWCPNWVRQKGRRGDPGGVVMAAGCGCWPEVNSTYTHKRTGSLVRPLLHLPIPDSCQSKTVCLVGPYHGASPMPAALCFLQITCDIFTRHVKALPCTLQENSGDCFNKHDGHVRQGDGPFCYGQITWDDGPSSSRMVRRAY